MRLSEVVGLRWEWIKRDASGGLYAELPASICKNGYSRKVELTAKAVALMGPQLEVGLVFRGERNNGLLHNVVRVMHAAAKRARLVNLSFHCFRHEGASRFMERGGDVRTLMEMGGWRDINMVTRYTHAVPGRARSVMEERSL
jgi:integrase